MVLTREHASQCEGDTQLLCRAPRQKLSFHGLSAGPRAVCPAGVQGCGCCWSEGRTPEPAPFCSTPQLHGHRMAHTTASIPPHGMGQPFQELRGCRKLQEPCHAQSSGFPQALAGPSCHMCSSSLPLPSALSLPHLRTPQPSRVLVEYW
jgi:hypothetical protein